MRVVYIHGFAGGANSNKIKILRREIGGGTIIAPAFAVDANVCETQIDNIILQLVESADPNQPSKFPIVFVGTSLGGFWANYAAQRYDTPCILINPATKPSVTLRKYLGKAYRDHLTGEKIFLTEDTIQTYLEREKYLADHTNGALINLMVAKDDSVIDYQMTLKNLPNVNSLMVSDTGGHSFNNAMPMAIQKIMELCLHK